MTSPEEVGVREIKAQTRILRSQLKQRLGSRIDEKDPLMSWIPCHAAKCASRHRIMDDVRTPDQRRCGKTWKRPVVEFDESVHFRQVGENNALRGGDQRLLRGVYVGHHERSGAAIFLTPDGVKRPDQRNLVRPVVFEEKTDQGVAPVIVMPAVPKVERRRYFTKRERERDLVKYGYTDECQACTQLTSDMHNTKVPHNDRCRDRIGELMAGDDDQRQVERVTSRAAVEVENETPCPETGEVVDVGEPTVVTLVNQQLWKINNQSHSQCHSRFHSQFPQFEWVEHQAQE